MNQILISRKSLRPGPPPDPYSVSSSTAHAYHTASLTQFVTILAYQTKQLVIVCLRSNDMDAEVARKSAGKSGPCASLV
jgi:hypothetical protein